MGFQEDLVEIDNKNKEIIDTLVKKIPKDWSRIKKFLNTWEISNLEKHLESFKSELNMLNSEWEEHEKAIEEIIEEVGEHLSSKEYANKLEECFRGLEIPFFGEFPEYEIRPFKIIILLESMEARLLFGRKTEKTNIMNPILLSEWVFKKHKSITSKKFDPNAFLKELIEAYKIANRLAFREKNIIWGKAVKLEEIYSLLTLKRVSKKDYPKQFYLYELGLLKENSSMELNEYKFEFGFAKDVSKSIAIIDSKGVVSRVSSLTIYKEE